MLSETAIDDHLAQASLQVVDQGSGRNTRVLSVAPVGGIHARVLVDRGLDLGSAWFGGLPIGWTSAAGERPSGHSDSAEGWHDGWAGGLLTTCGLRNVGMPSEGHGRHGRYSDQAADEVSLTRELLADGTGRIVIDGTVREHFELGRGLVLRRRITFALWDGAIEIDDTTVNESGQRMQSPLLYHVNVGAPFLDALSRPLVRESDDFEPSSFVEPMGPAADVPDVVAELQVPRQLDGWAECALDSARLGLRMRIGWTAASLPRLFAWQRRTRGTYVTALEPANCSVAGRLADRASGTAPWLESGEARHTRLRIAVEKLTRVEVPGVG